MKKKKYNFIDLFSGCGGFSCGLELAGHKCLLGVDSDPHAIKTFSENHPHASVFDRPIEELSERKIKSILQNQKVQLIVGGPPCQGFSTVGKGMSNDHRNKLFIHFVKVVRWLKPELIILENVTGLLAKKNATTLKAIFKNFEKLGYQLSARILKAEEYGVPTMRRRTFIVGSLKRCPEDFFPGHTSKRRYVKDAWESWMSTSGGNIYNHDKKSSQIINDLDKKRLSCIPEGASIRYQEDEQKYLPPSLKLQVNWDLLPEKRFRQKKYHRLNRNDHSPTIMTSNRNYYHPTEARYLTVREVAALQSFPAHFKFHGSLTSMYRQIGNAVPPLLAKAFGEHLARLDNKTVTSKVSSKKVSFTALRSKAFRYVEEAIHE